MLIDQQLRTNKLNARSADRILRLAWSVADLQGHDVPSGDDVETALSLRRGTPLGSAMRERALKGKWPFVIDIRTGIRPLFADRLAATVGRESVSSGAALVARLRGRKDARELALLRRANELTQRAIRAMAATLEPGLSSDEIGARAPPARM